MSHQNKKIKIDRKQLQKMMDAINFIGFAAQQIKDFLHQLVQPILEKNKELIGLNTELKV